MLLVCQGAAMCFQSVLCVSKGLDLSVLTHKKKQSSISLKIYEHLIDQRLSNLVSLFTDFCRFPTASKASSDRGYAVFSPVIRPCRLLKHVC